MDREDNALDIGPSPFLDPRGEIMANARSVLTDLLLLRESISYGQSASAGLMSVQLAGLDEILSQAWRVAQDVINASSPVNRLPPDLLAAIFALVPSPLPDLADPPYGSGKMYRTQELQPITAVCRYWREIGLNTPSLWSTIIDTSKLNLRYETQITPIYPGYLHRCKTALLRIYLRFEPSVSTIEMLRQEQGRVKELWAQAVRLDNSYENSIAAMSFPELEYCSMKVVGAMPADRVSRTVPLFGSNVRLRTLILTNSPFAPSNDFPALTHLRLSQDRDFPYATLGDIVAFISRAPRLRQLELDNLAYHRTPPSLDGWQGGTLHLRNLKHFIVTDGPCYSYSSRDEHIALFRKALFATLSLPHTCVIEMGVFYNDDFGVCADALPTRRSTHVWLTHIPYPRSTSNGFFVLLEASDPANSQRTRFRFHGPSHPSVARVMGGSVRSFLVPALSRSPIFSSVMKAWFDARMGMLFRASAPVLACLPRAEMIVIRAGDWYSPRAKNILSALEVQEHADGAAACALPALAMLLVDCKHTADVPYVHEVVDARARAGYPLQRLFVGSWGGDDLKEYVLQEYKDATLVRTGGENIVQELWDEFSAM